VHPNEITKPRGIARLSACIPCNACGDYTLRFFGGVSIRGADRMILNSCKSSFFARSLLSDKSLFPVNEPVVYIMPTNAQIATRTPFATTLGAMEDNPPASDIASPASPVSAHLTGAANNTTSPSLPVASTAEAAIDANAVTRPADTIKTIQPTDTTLWEQFLRNTHTSKTAATIIDEIKTVNAGIETLQTLEQSAASASANQPGATMSEISSAISRLGINLARANKSITALQHEFPKNSSERAALKFMSLPLRQMEYGLQRRLIGNTLRAQWKDLPPGKNKSIQFDLNLQGTGDSPARLAKLDMTCCWHVIVNDEQTLEVVSHKGLWGAVNIGGAKPVVGLLEKLAQTLGMPLDFISKKLSPYLNLVTENKTIFLDLDEFIDHNAEMMLAANAAMDFLKESSFTDKAALIFQKLTGIRVISTDNGLRSTRAAYGEEGQKWLHLTGALASNERLASYSNASKTPMSSRVAGVGLTGNGMPHVQDTQGKLNRSTRTVMHRSRLQAMESQTGLLGAIKTGKNLVIHLFGATHPGTEITTGEGKKEIGPYPDRTLAGKNAAKWLNTLGARIRSLKNTRSPDAAEGLTVLRKQLEDAMKANFVAAKHIEKLWVQEADGGPFKKITHTDRNRPASGHIKHWLDGRRKAAQAAAVRQHMSKEHHISTTADLFSARSVIETMRAHIDTHAWLKQLWKETFIDPVSAPSDAHIQDMEHFFEDPTGFAPTIRNRMTELPFELHGQTTHVSSPVDFVLNGATVPATIRYTQNRNYAQQGRFLDILFNEDQALALRSALKTQASGKLDERIASTIDAWMKTTLKTEARVERLSQSEIQFLAEKLPRNGGEALLMRYTLPEHDEASYQLQYLRTSATRKSFATKDAKIELPLVTLTATLSGENTEVLSEQLGCNTLSYLKKACGESRALSDPAHRLMTDHKETLKGLLSSISTQDNLRKELDSIAAEYSTIPEVTNGIDAVNETAKTFKATPSDAHFNAGMKALSQLFAALSPLEKAASEARFEARF
jgi:hypothetical protein